MTETLENPKISAAKASLDKMLELIGPYLPKPDTKPYEDRSVWIIERAETRQSCSQKARQKPLPQSFF